MTKIEKFKDISTLFNIKTIEDNQIVVDNNKVNVNEYIYEIMPISMLNYSNEDMSKVLNTYIEFLKSIDVRFKILIRNEKFDKKEYIDKYLTKSNFLNKEVYRNYIEYLRSKIENEDIYTIKTYICFICEKEKIKNLEESLLKFNAIGIHVKKLKKEEIYEILYKSINKIY